MTAINGLPAHLLFVHFVLGPPLTLLLEIACALSPAARRGQLAQETRLRTAGVGFTIDIILGAPWAGSFMWLVVGVVGGATPHHRGSAARSIVSKTHC